MKRLVTTVVFTLLSFGAGATSPGPVTFTNYAAQFDDFEGRTEGMPAEQRGKELLATFNTLVPGLYVDKDPAHLARREGARAAAPG